jgi:hypothetical protein
MGGGEEAGGTVWGAERGVGTGGLREVGLGERDEDLKSKRKKQVKVFGGRIR